MKLKHLLFVLPLLLIGCGPVQLEQNVEVGPSETAYLVSLEKDNQGKFESIEYLDKQKVAAKRILLPQRAQSLGRAPWSYRYIPTARVIKVDRKPISRKWTGDRNATTEGANYTDAATSPLEVESLDSIGFAISNLQKITDASLSISYDIFDKFLYDYISSTSTRDRIVKLFLGNIHSIPITYMVICNDKRLVPIVKQVLRSLIETAKRKDKKLVPMYRNLLQEIEKQTKS